MGRASPIAEYRAGIISRTIAGTATGVPLCVARYTPDFLSFPALLMLHNPVLVKGARQNNLKGFDLKLPLNELIVVWALPVTRGNRLESEIFEMIGHHLDGLLLGPLMIAAKMHGLLEEDQVPLNKLFGSRVPLEKGPELLEHFGWVNRQGPRWVFTELGKPDPVEFDIG